MMTRHPAVSPSPSLHLSPPCQIGVEPVSRMQARQVVDQTLLRQVHGEMCLLARQQKRRRRGKPGSG